MRQFNTPPGWPDPPTARWRPPKHWQPAETWPPAPHGWAFWVNENGKRVRGPLGRYGGASRVKLAAIAAVPLALIGLVLVNPFGGHESTTTEPSVRATTVPARVPTTAPTTGPATAPTTGPATTAETPGSTETPTGQETRTPTPDPTESSLPTPVPESRTTSTEAPTPTVEPTSAPATTSTAAFKSCAEARAAGKVPLRRGDPGYSDKLDHNGDGVACERGNS